MELLSVRLIYLVRQSAPRKLSLSIHLFITILLAVALSLYVDVKSLAAVSFSSYLGLILNPVILRCIKKKLTPDVRKLDTLALWFITDFVTVTKYY